jgi:membrane protein
MWSSLATAAADWSRNDGPMMSAALAFYGALSLFPCCLLLISGLGYLSHVSSDFQDRQDQLVLLVATDISPWLADQLEVMFTGIKAGAGIAGPVAIVSLLLAAITAFVQLDDSFTRIWSVAGVQDKGLWAALRTALYERLAAFLILLAIGSLMGVLLLLNIALASFRPFVMHWTAGGTLWQSFEIAVTIALNGASLTALYKALPKAAVSWQAAACGGLLAAAVWQIGQRLLESYVISDKYGVYGVLGAFMAVMLWMYYASAVVLWGAFVVRNLESRYAGGRP